MIETEVEIPAPITDLNDLETLGEGLTTTLIDIFPTIDATMTPEEAVAAINANLASITQGYPAVIAQFTTEAVNPLIDAINDGIVPVGQAQYFYGWLAYNQGVTWVPVNGTYAFIQGYVLQWAQDNGWATYGPNPEPTPLAQAFIESATAASPLPGTAPAPVTLPSPSQGQQAVVGTAGTITPSTVTGGTTEGTSAEQVSAALAVTFVDAMRVMASVFDAFLPGMAPGQVPDALDQLNRAINALEAQMGQVRAGEWPRGFVGLQEAVNGALQALNGLEQEVGILAQQMATKADSGLEDGITANSTAIAGLTGTVAGVVGTAIPELSSGLQSLTSMVGDLDNTVTNDVEPALAQVTADTAANTKMLSGTDQDCLDQLCDAEGNVTNPIKEGGATPSLLKNLGALLGLGWVESTIFGLMTTAATLLDAPYALAVVAQDTEQLAAWAESAASAIETELPVQ